MTLLQTSDFTGFRIESDLLPNVIVLNNRERFIGVMNFEKVDKVPLIPQMGGGAYNIATEGSVTSNRWHAEGLPAWSSTVDYFEISFAYKSIPVNLDMIPLFLVKTLSEESKYFQIVAFT